MRLSQQPTLKALLLFSFALLLFSNAIAAPKFATKALLNAQMAAERNARVAADNGLTTGLSTETNARISADTAEVTARQQAIQAAINALQAQLNAIALPPLPTGQFQVSLTRCGNSNTLQWESCHYATGDTGPAGGIVFYVTDGGMHGLEVAPVDQGFAPWGCNGTAITGADSHTVGSGAQNTRDILAGCNEAGIAAKIADDYTLNGYSDWFLPSIDELTFMWANIGLGAAPPLTNAGGFDTSTSWSSSEFSSVSGWVQRFDQSGGTSGSPFKLNSFKVRAIRAF
jgi:hypothetical protein